MNRGKCLRILLLLACMVMLLCACDSDKDDADGRDRPSGNESTTVSPSGNESATVSPSAAGTSTPTPIVMTPTPTVTPTKAQGRPDYDFSAERVEIDRKMNAAIAQYNHEDYTNLDEPVTYYVLWLGFTHVTFGDLDFQMTDFDREYLEAVALNYEKSVESIANHNVDIVVDLHFIDDVMPLTQYPGEDWLYLAKETAMPFIEPYLAQQEVDTVLTTVQTAGEENRERNADKEGYGVNDVILGLELAGLSSDLGYSTFNLSEPKEGTYPLADPEIPSLYATAVAVHEWMHQLEYLGALLGIEYPNTHAYMGPSSFPGYEQYIADANDYDFFEFYKLVLQGKLPYTGNGSVKLVGMYPKMWPLIKRNYLNIGTFTIKAADGSGYLYAQTGDVPLTISDEPCLWKIRVIEDNKYTISPKEYPDLLIDLGNAWDIEGNTIGLWKYTGYVDAQSWYIVVDYNGSGYIKTPYESGRVLTATEKGQPTILCTPGTGGVQKWIFEFEK